MLERYEELELNRFLGKMRDAVNMRNWLKMHDVALVTKESCPYVGLARLYYTSVSIKILYRRYAHDLLLSWYQMYIEKVIEAKRYIRQYLANLESDESEFQVYVEE